MQTPTQDTLFRWDAPVSHSEWRDFQDDLNALVEPSDNVSWLYARWEAGDRWEPVQRWMLWQVVPLHATPDYILDALKGPHPRSTGHYCSGRLEDKCWCAFENPQYEPRNRWIGGPTRFISRQEWDIYREIGRYARPWWVVQGDNGGHRKVLAHWEQMALAQVDVDWSPPLAGDLPYAPLDARVLRWVKHYDLMGKVGAFYNRNADVMEQEEARNKLAAAKVYAAWVTQQSESFWDEAGDLIKAVKNNLGYRPGGEGGGKTFGVKKDYEQLLENTITRIATK